VQNIFSAGFTLLKESKRQLSPLPNTRTCVCLPSASLALVLEYFTQSSTNPTGVSEQQAAIIAFSLLEAMHEPRRTTFNVTTEKHLHVEVRWRNRKIETRGSAHSRCQSWRLSFAVPSCQLGWYWDLMRIRLLGRCWRWRAGGGEEAGGWY